MALRGRSCSIGRLGRKRFAGLGLVVAQASAQDGNDGPALAGGALPVVLRRGWPALAPAPARLPVAARLRRTALRVAAAARTAVAEERERGTAFVLIPVLFGAGAAANFSLAREPAPLVVAGIAALAACAMLLAASRPRLRALSAAVLVLALGMLAASLEIRLAGTQMLGAEITTRITGRVVAVERRVDRPPRLTIDLIATERPHLRYAPQRIRVTARKLPEGLAAGATVTGAVRLLPPGGPVRPNSYDFSFQSYFLGIGASGFFLRGPDIAAAAGAPDIWARLTILTENVRDALAARIRAHISGSEGEIAAALIAGVRGGIPEADNEALRKTGLAHVLSISGLHMALVAGTVLGAMRAIFALFPGFSSQHPVKKYAAATALVAITLYLAISGMDVAAERSHIMCAVMLAAVLFDRAALTMRNLAISALIVLAVSPHEVMGPSFQMSFAATAALIAAYGWHAERRRRAPQDGARQADAPAVRRWAGWALAFFGGLAATSLIAGAATGLYAAWHFERMAPLGLVANLLAMPIVSVAVMPMAVAGTVLMPLGIDGPFFVIMGKGLSAMLAIAHWLAERTPIDAVGLVPPAAVVVLSVALVILTAATTWLRAAALPFLALGVVLILGRQMPDVLIAEDGRLMALRLSDGRLAVNRPRPAAFELEDWSRALMAGTIVKPGKGALAESGEEQPFRCADGLCLGRHASGAVVASAPTAEAARPACAGAALILILDATAGNPCGRDGAARVVTARDLARRGSVALRFGAQGGIADLAFAIGEEDRPWHSQRRFSREARGLPPYQAKGRTAAGKKPAAAASTEVKQGDVTAKAAVGR